MDSTNFQEQAVIFLEAVKRKNFKKFQEFLSPALRLTAVLPNGKTFSTHESFLESQRSYFDGETGRFEYRIHELLTVDSLGFCSIWVDYSDITSDGKSFNKKLYISFLFQKIQDQWFLIHDQNTELLKGEL